MGLRLRRGRLGGRFGSIRRPGFLHMLRFSKLSALCQRTRCLRPGKPAKKLTAATRPCVGISGDLILPRSSVCGFSCRCSQRIGRLAETLTASGVIARTGKALSRGSGWITLSAYWQALQLGCRCPVVMRAPSIACCSRCRGELAADCMPSIRRSASRADWFDVLGETKSCTVLPATTLAFVVSCCCFPLLLRFVVLLGLALGCPAALSLGQARASVDAHLPSPFYGRLLAGRHRVLHVGVFFLTSAVKFWARTGAYLLNQLTNSRRLELAATPIRHHTLQQKGSHGLRGRRHVGCTVIQRISDILCASSCLHLQHATAVLILLDFADVLASGRGMHTWYSMQDKTMFEFRYP